MNLIEEFIDFGLGQDPLVKIEDLLEVMLELIQNPFVVLVPINAISSSRQITPYCGSMSPLLGD